MTLAELLIAMGIFLVIVIVIVDFNTNIYYYQSTISGSFQTSLNAQTILKTMLKEIRQAQPAANGSYPLANAGSSTITFFSDADSNGAVEQITYTRIGNTLFRSTIPPTGSPPVYLGANQATTTLLGSVVNASSTPIFQYYDTNYTGTSTPLAQPVTTTTVRLVKVSVTLDLDPTHSPLPTTYTVQASFRNLKTNL